MNPSAVNHSQAARLNKRKEAIYNKVTNEKRIQLLTLVKKQGKSLKEASKALNINYSTAKTILRVFRLEKRIFKKSSLLSPIESQADNRLSFDAYAPFAPQSAFCFEGLNNIISFTNKCLHQAIANEFLIKSIQDTLNSIQFNSTAMDKLNCL